jgi:hypothetical protein
MVDKKTWETPEIEPLTDTQSRAQRTDISTRNGIPNGASGSV